MKFEITKEDIENGVPGDTFKCPAALAIKRNLFPNAEVRVGTYIVTIDGYLFKTPFRLFRFIAEFDSFPPTRVRDEIELISFELPYQI